MTAAIHILGTTLDPGGLLMWLIVGLVAGEGASRVMRREGYGVITVSKKYVINQQ